MQVGLPTRDDVDHHQPDAARQVGRALRGELATLQLAVLVAGADQFDGRDEFGPGIRTQHPDLKGVGEHRWEDAIRKCDEVLRQKPDEELARDRRQRAEAERKNQEAYNRYQKAVSDRDVTVDCCRAQPALVSPPASAMKKQPKCTIRLLTPPLPNYSQK